MPKPKPDNVVRHEIVLGRSEREMLRDAFTAYQVNKVAVPFVSAVSDISFMAWVLLAYNYFFNENLPISEEAGGLVTSLKQDFDFYRTTKEYQDNYQKRAASGLGGLRNLFENIIGGLGKGPDDINL